MTKRDSGKPQSVNREENRHDIVSFLPISKSEDLQKVHDTKQNQETYRRVFTVQKSQQIGLDVCEAILIV